jgi:hypothetical protein
MGKRRKSDSESSAYEESVEDEYSEEYTESTE